MKLDVTKPYGTVHGSLDNRRYEQAGKFFDYQMNEVVPVDLAAAFQQGPVPRTKEEKAQYEKDVADAAALIAAGKK